MKQTITQKQYEELSAREQQILMEWVFSKGQTALSHLFSIGHLSWFLDEHTKDMGWLHIETPGERTGWRVQCKYIEFDEEAKPELIDALWEAVKVVVRQEQV